MKKGNKVDVAKKEMLYRKSAKDKSKEGYDFILDNYKWTNIDEQKQIVKEIEDKTK